jgi:hypothetical protein
MITLVDFIKAHAQLATGVCYGLLALVIVLSAGVDKSHAHSWVEQNVPFFWSIFAFLATAIIIGFARWFGGSGIQAPVNFYQCESDYSEEEA